MRLIRQHLSLENPGHSGTNDAGRNGILIFWANTFGQRSQREIAANMRRYSRIPNVSVRGRRVATLVLLCLTLLAPAGCVPESFASTPFDREISDIASTLSASASTIEFLHTGKVDRRYARASMIVYRETLQSAAIKLPGLRGAPDPDDLTRTVNQLTQAQALLADPCLEDNCDWSAQVHQLQETSNDLLGLAS